MINPNELRIGNLVYSPKDIDYDPAGIIEVKTIGMFGINYWQDMCASGEGEFEILEPIPITEDILLQLGFVKAGNGNFLHYRTPNNFYVSFCLITCDPYKKGDIIAGNSETSIKYVHELQNLYFALCKKELEYKPETIKQ